MNQLVREGILIMLICICIFIAVITHSNSIIADCDKTGRVLLNTTLIKCEVIE